MVNALNDQDFTFVEVTPGGPDDPFTARNATSLPAAAASPVQLAGGAVALAPVEGSQVFVTPVVASSAAQHVTPASPVTAAAPAPAVPLSPLQQAIQDGKLDEYIAGQIQTQTGTVVRGLQSSYDKRVAALEKERDEAREAVKSAQRESKLESEDLTDDEKDVLRERWKLQDEREALDAEVAVADEYYKSLYATGLAQENPQFGVTVEALMGLETPEEMDAFVRDQEVAYLRAQINGTVVVPSGVAVAAGTIQAPAGASAPTDVGGQAPATPPKAAPTGMGVDAMKEHMAQLKWETVPFN